MCVRCRTRGMSVIYPHKGLPSRRPSLPQSHPLVCITKHRTDSLSRHHLKREVNQREVQWAVNVSCMILRRRWQVSARLVWSGLRVGGGRETHLAARRRHSCAKRHAPPLRGAGQPAAGGRLGGVPARRFATPIAGGPLHWALGGGLDRGWGRRLAYQVGASRVSALLRVSTSSCRAPIAPLGGVRRRLRPDVVAVVVASRPAPWRSVA